jgi:hypothetical protein
VFERAPEQLAFMSTTPLPEVAVKYSGKQEEAGSIFAIDFDMASRGAEIDWLSQFPHERELLFPPCTMLECTGYFMRGAKRLVMVRATVSTAMPDTSGIEEPDDVPASGGASTAKKEEEQTEEASEAGCSSPELPTVVSVHMANKSSKLSQIMSSLKSLGSSKRVEDEDPLRALRAGLRELLTPLKLDGISPFGSQTKEKLGLAMAWCEEMGATTVEELFELDEEDRNGFLAALKLRPLKQKALLKKLTPAADTNPPPSSSAGNVALNAHV